MHTEPMRWSRIRSPTILFETVTVLGPSASIPSIVFVRSDSMDHTWGKLLNHVKHRSEHLDEYGFSPASNRELQMMEHMWWLCKKVEKEQWVQANEETCISNRWFHVPVQFGFSFRVMTRIEQISANMSVGLCHARSHGAHECGCHVGSAAVWGGVSGHCSGECGHTHGHRIKWTLSARTRRYLHSCSDA